MSSSIFSLNKNSQAYNYNYKDEYDAFFSQHGGEEKKLDVHPPFNGEITSQRKKLISDNIEAMKSPDKEKDMYVSLAKALTHVSIAVAKHNEHTKSLVFVPNSNSRIRSMPESNEIELPDLVAFTMTIAKARQASTSFPPIPPAFCLDGLVEQKVKDSNEVVRQSLRYLFSDSRHHPGSFLRHALLANKYHFQLVTLGLDHHYLWPTINWTDENWIERLCSYVDIMAQEARKQRPESIPTLLKVIEDKTKPIGIFMVKVGEDKYRLLPSFCGRGNGRKPFVALGVSMNGKKVRVFKYAWYGKTQLDRERTILEKLKDAPGVVHIDSSLSQRVIEDNKTDIIGIDLDEESIRKRSLLVLRTVGYPLCACESVQEFLEAMYDLLEVLRFVAQEKSILHRDISWSNVLVRPKEYHDNFDTKATIANAKKDQDSKENIPHDYRFVSDIFSENDRKVRIALADFDHSVDLEKDDKDELKNATGTPMFMAEDVLSVRNSSVMTSFSRIYRTILGQALNDCVDKYADYQEKREWDEFYEHFTELRWKIEPEEHNDNALLQSFRHGAVHDAESVFYLCLLFFNRLWSFDEYIKRSEIGALEENRGRLFEIFAGRRCGRPTVRFDFLERTSFAAGERFEPFYVMLKTMLSYVRVPWYNVAETGRRERYEFHLHDFMQRLILKEIRRLRSNGDPIRIEMNPVGARTALQTAGNLYTSKCSDMFMFRGVSPRLSVEITVAYLHCQDKRPRATVTDTSLNLPVSIPKEMPNPAKQMLPDFFWDIYWVKRREKTWLVADKLFRPSERNKG
ncbi:hypothetical protein ACEPAG_8482 [Sanghuangporus baumii]